MLTADHRFFYHASCDLVNDLPEGDVDHRVDGLVVHVPDVPLAAVAPELGHGEEVGQVHELGDVVLVDDDVAGVAEGEDGVEDLVVLALVDAQVLAGRLVHLQLGVEPRTGGIYHIVQKLP